MKLRKAIFLFFVMLTPVAFWYIISPLSRSYGKWYYNQIKNNSKVYSYDTFNSVLERALYIETMSNKDDFVNFYNEKVKGIDMPISFSINNIPYNRALYVVDNSDPQLLKVVDYDTTCWGFISVYIDRRTVSSHKPSQKLISKHEEFIENYKKSDDYKLRRIGKKRNNTISQYGINCQCE